MQHGVFGQVFKQKDLDNIFLPGPGEFLVTKTLQQMALVQGQPDPKTGKPTFPFQILFGPYKEGSDQQRWADYQRFDWAVTQLPAINVFEGDSQNKTSDQAWLMGTIKFQIYWPPNQRRSDLARVQQAFQSALEQFFSSKYVREMLDELYYIQRPAKVYGLNEYGKELSWTPNVEGFAANELVPVTIVDVKYRIDKRAWYRALEFFDRTKANPFQKTLVPLTGVDGVYKGEDSTGTVWVEIDDSFNLTNP